MYSIKMLGTGHAVLQTEQYLKNRTGKVMII